jgi:hypothetical protein
MNKVEIQFTTSVDRLLSFCAHAVRFELEYMSKTGYWFNFKGVYAIKPTVDSRKHDKDVHAVAALSMFTCLCCLYNIDPLQVEKAARPPPFWKVNF